MPKTSPIGRWDTDTCPNSQWETFLAFLLKKIVIINPRTHLPHFISRDNLANFGEEAREPEALGQGKVFIFFLLNIKQIIDYIYICENRNVVSFGVFF